MWKLFHNRSRNTLALLLAGLLGALALWVPVLVQDRSMPLNHILIYWGIGFAVLVFLGWQLFFWFRLLKIEQTVLQQLPFVILRNDKFPKAQSVIEEMKIASGLKYSPQFFIWQSATPNAFIFGWAPRQLYLGFSEGLLNKLEPSELQAVVAHLMARSQSLSFNFLVSYQVIKFLLFGTFNSFSREEPWVKKLFRFLIWIALSPLMVLLWLVFSLFAKLPSSLREDILEADALSVRWTRNPSAVISGFEQLFRAADVTQNFPTYFIPFCAVHPHQNPHYFKPWEIEPFFETRIQFLKEIKGSQDYSVTLVKTLLKRFRIRKTLQKNLQNFKRQQNDFLEGKIHWRKGKWNRIFCNCGKSIEVSPGFKGKNIQCPDCQYTFELI